MPDWADVAVRCPYFRKRMSGDGGCRVLCEGITEGGSLSHRFRDKAQMDRHMAQFCEDNYHRCEIHAMLERVHEDQGGMIVTEIRPDPDSQFRLRSCGCGGEARYIGFDTDEWAVRCTVCGRTGVRGRLRHDCQIHWNRGGRFD